MQSNSKNTISHDVMSPVLIKYLYLNTVIFFFLILYRFALYWENAEFYNIYKEHVRFSYVHSQEIHEMIFLVSSLFLSITLFYIKSKNEKKKMENCFNSDVPSHI